MTTVSALRFNGGPGFCAGCHRPLPVRKGRTEAQLGLDGQLYCYAMTPECELLAITPIAPRGIGHRFGISSSAA